MSRTTDDAGNHDFSNTTNHIARSGALVFATGSTYWTRSLDTYRFSNDQLCASQGPVIPGIQKLMANIMDALVVLHPPYDPTQDTPCGYPGAVADTCIVTYGYSTQCYT